MFRLFFTYKTVDLVMFSRSLVHISHSLREDRADGGNEETPVVSIDVSFFVVSRTEFGVYARDRP